MLVIPCFANRVIESPSGMRPRRPDLLASFPLLCCLLRVLVTKFLSCGSDQREVARRMSGSPPAEICVKPLVPRVSEIDHGTHFLLVFSYMNLY